MSCVSIPIVCPSWVGVKKMKKELILLESWPSQETLCYPFNMSVNYIFYQMPVVSALYWLKARIVLKQLLADYQERRLENSLLEKLYRSE